MNTTSTNGTHTRTFTPTQGFVRVKYSASAAFSLANATLNMVDVDTVYTVLARGGYRYGFQSQERDDEVKGAGNSVNYTYRMHDPRIGRFFARDPLANEYPHYSPYSFSGNILIHNVELEGLENIHYLEKKVDGTWGAVQINGKDWIDVISELDENVNCYLYGWPNGSGVMKSVYKSHQQGGKDRWEHWGGTAPYDLLRAHYDHDHSQATNAVEMSRAAAGPAPWYRKGLLGDWSGGHDGANLGGWGGSKDREIKGATGALSVILAPFTIAGGGVWITVGSIGLLNGADDMVGAIKNTNAESLSQSLVSDPHYKDLIGKLKTGATFVTAIGGGAQMWKMGVDAPTLIGVANDVQSLVRDVSDKLNQNNSNNNSNRDN